MFALPDARSARSQAASRREFLKTGAIALGGLALPALSAPFAHAISAATRGSKSVIFVYLAGGPSHLDMYDMKPDAPAEIRGEFRPIHTNVPGMNVCEHLPLHAKIADKFAIVNGLESVDIHDPSVLADDPGAVAPESTCSCQARSRGRVAWNLLIGILSSCRMAIGTRMAVCWAGHCPSSTN